jgi:hypothetical protein
MLHGRASQRTPAGYESGVAIFFQSWTATENTANAKPFSRSLTTGRKPFRSCWMPVVFPMRSSAYPRSVANLDFLGFGNSSVQFVSGLSYFPEPRLIECGSRN